MTDPSAPLDREELVRRAARKWLEERSLGGTIGIHGTDLRSDFRFEGERVPLMDQKGIWKPAWMTAALTFRTAYTSPSKPRPYEDEPGPDGLPRYKWRGTDANHADNRALRSAMQQRVPLVWLYGIAPAEYLPILDVYLIGEEPRQHQFVVGSEAAAMVPQESRAEEWLRRYLLTLTKQRLHQPVFRASVIKAYEERCSVCALNHPELLDAAHIVPDRDEAGIAAVRNGLALCKIHHAAFDRGFLGVRPDLVVEIRQDLLDEVDGPMLRHGLQGRHQQPLMSIPKHRAERPARELLEDAYAKFREQGAA